MHMFAIDGLRIALLSGMIVTLLRVMRLSRAWSGAIAIPVIWFYTAATGWESSAVRASVMMTIVLGGWALKRPSDLVNSLAAAAFLILLWNSVPVVRGKLPTFLFRDAHDWIAPAAAQSIHGRAVAARPVVAGIARTEMAAHAVWSARAPVRFRYFSPR